jgi:hypothetical protein
MRSRMPVPSLLLGALVGLAPSVVHAQTAPTLDHFECYRTTAQPPNVTVLLKDQFVVPGIPPALPFVVLNPVRFCNPVEKTTSAGVVTPITNPDGHLELFLTGPAALKPSWKVLVKNQFGRQTLRAFSPEILAVPTAKNDQPPPVPGSLDHFQCYRAYGASLTSRVKQTTVQLRDQFHTDPETVKLLRPVAFCNPVEKTHDGVVTPIAHPDDHLVCYAFAPTTFTGGALARNQFGSGPIPLAGADILCVPSQKLKFSVIF